MHWLGKFFAFCILIAALAAGLLTSKLVVVRNSWTSKVATAKKKYHTELKPKVEELESTVERLKNNLSRTQELWGRSWNGVQTNISPADGSANISIGSESEISQGLVLHGFEVADDGKSIYRGSFLVADAGNGSSILKPTWRVKSDEFKKWQSGTWRWRNLIPSGYPDVIDKQQVSILKYEETLADRTRTLAAQKNLYEKANDTLKLREAELVGGDLLPKSGSIAVEFRDGLVAAVEQTEEERNQALKKIDELRHKVREVQAEIERLNAENMGLANRLPQPAADQKVTQKKN